MWKLKQQGEIKGSKYEQIVTSVNIIIAQFPEIKNTHIMCQTSYLFGV